MLKITTVCEDERAVTLIVDGRITGSCIEVLETLCSHHICVNNKHVLLDLKGVTFIDNQGVKMLKKLQRNRLAVIDSTLYIKSLLNRAEEELENIDKGCCTKEFRP